ncbi:MAG: MraY family glycosyltransferase [Microgenomates group bacterium]
MWLEHILIPFFLTVAITMGVTPLVIWFAKKYGLVDDPKKRFHPAHTHKGIIPRAGGLAVYIGIMAVAMIFLPINKLFIGVALSCLIFTVVGLLDDKNDVSPYIRILTNSLAIGIAILAGAGVPYITNPFTGGLLHLDTWRITIDFFGVHSLLVWSALTAFIWLMWTTNIVGWSAGVEGQMPGFVSISAAIIGILSLRYSFADPSQLPITILAFIVSGAYAGFLPWNFYPQKIMPGYSGKTLAGFLLGLLAILSYGKLGTALLVLGIPTIDAIFTLVRRVLKGKSPVWADRKHLHHVLMDAGWGKRRIALFYWGVSAILGIIALVINSRQKIFTLFLVAVAIGGFFLWVNFFSQFSKPQDHDNG